MDTTKINPLVCGSKLTMYLLGIGRSSFDDFVASGRLNDLKLFPKKKTFAFAEIEALAKLPKQEPQTKNTTQNENQNNTTKEIS